MNAAPGTPFNVVPAPGTRTKQLTSVPVAATAIDPDGTQYRILYRLSTSSAFTSYTDHYTGYYNSNTPTAGSLTPLVRDTHYFVRVYAQDPSGVYSVAYKATDFYTNTTPPAPTSVVPAPNTHTMSYTDSPITLSAHVSDPDGGQVRALFRYSDDNFGTYTDVYSAYITSPGTATVTINDGDNLLNNADHYKMYVYAQDDVGVFSSPTSSDWYMNLPPDPPTLIRPISGANLDSTQPQNFVWQFNDPDLAYGDSQSDGQLRYRPYIAGDDPEGSDWIYSSNFGPVSSIQFAANSFTPNTVYEWQVRLNDNIGAYSDWSASSYFIASVPSMSMSASGGMNNNPLVSRSVGNTFLATSQLNIGSTTKYISSPIPMVATAQLVSTPLSVIIVSNAFAATASLTSYPTVSRSLTLPLTATASLSSVGMKTVSSPVLFMATHGAMSIQVTQGINFINVLAAMNVNPSALNIKPTISLAAHAQLAQIVDTSKGGTIPMVAHAAIASVGKAARLQVTQMVVHGSLVQSAALSRSPGVVMAAKAILKPTGHLVITKALPLSAKASLSQLVRVNEDVFVGMLASASLTAVDHGGHIFTIVPMSAIASVGFNAISDILREVRFIAHASMDIGKNGEQQIFEGPYLIVTDDVLGTTMSFTASGFPMPRSVRNTPTYENVGGVTP